MVWIQKNTIIHTRRWESFSKNRQFSNHYQLFIQKTNRLSIYLELGSKIQKIEKSLFSKDKKWEELGNKGINKF